MFISQIYLDRGKHDTARALYNRNILHGAIEQCFHGERQHPLWRIDSNGGRLSVLVVSKDVPDFSLFEKQFGISGVPPQTKSYDDFLKKSVSQGEIMRFHITANPTIKKDGKRIPLNMRPTSKQKYCASDWFSDRLESHGAKIISGEITSYDTHRIKKEKNTITMVTADFDGYLKVVNRVKMVEALSNGIGHGKAYGCGMITVMRRD